MSGGWASPSWVRVRAVLVGLAGVCATAGAYLLMKPGASPRGWVAYSAYTPSPQALAQAQDHTRGMALGIAAGLVLALTVGVELGRRSVHPDGPPTGVSDDEVLGFGPR